MLSPKKKVKVVSVKTAGVLRLADVAVVSYESFHYTWQSAERQHALIATSQ